jgi:hypothetical protein
MERFVLQAEIQILVVQIDSLGGNAIAIDDTGNPAGATQAAARSGALRITLDCIDFDLHVLLLTVEKGPPRPGGPACKPVIR